MSKPKSKKSQESKTLGEKILGAVDDMLHPEKKDETSAQAEVPTSSDGSHDLAKRKTKAADQFSSASR